MYFRLIVESFVMGGICVFFHWLVSFTGIIDKPTWKGFLVFSLLYFIIRIIFVWIRTFQLRNEYKKKVTAEMMKELKRFSKENKEE